jgi:deoxyribose-phosphate aldolase
MTSGPGALVALIDLTSLGQDDDAEVVRALCGRAATPLGPVAAVCVVPALVEVAVDALAGSPVRVATVANFPDGDDRPDVAAAQVAAAVAAGADEVDVVVPWRTALARRDEAPVARLVAACAQVTGDGVLKAILETGSHDDAGATRAMADAALHAGARFVKTSTGKVGPGASPEAVRLLLEAVRDRGSGGVKVSGGVRTAAQAHGYAEIAAEVLGAPPTPATFRIGASTLLDDLLGAP